MQTVNQLSVLRIKEEGTSNGAITDFDGNYSLTVSSPDAILQFSYVGYKSEEFMADKGVINVTMREDTERLDEVGCYSIGYQNVQKKRCHTMFSK